MQDPVIALAREHIDQAVAFGLDRGYRKQLDALLGGIAAQAPRTPHINGVVLAPSATSPLAIVSRPDRRQRDSCPLGQERRSGHQARRFKRYASPVLLVLIHGRAFRTMDWSIGGLLLAGVPEDVADGSEITLHVRVEAMRDQAPLEDRALVVRVNAAAGCTSLRFKTGTSATLKLLELLSRNRISPAEPGER